MSVYASQAGGSTLLSSVPDLVSQDTRLSLGISNELLAWDNHAGLAGELTSPHLFALDGQADTEGPVNYDVYAGFNRTVGNNLRTGTGVTKVILRLFSDLPAPPLFSDGFESGDLSAWSSTTP